MSEGRKSETIGVEVDVDKASKSLPQRRLNSPLPPGSAGEDSRQKSAADGTS